PQRHSRVHAKLARRVRCSRDHAPLVPLPAHHHRLAFQRRVKQFLDRHEEGVHIDVKDSAWGGGAHRSPGGLAEVYREGGAIPMKPRLTLALPAPTLAKYGSATHPRPKGLCPASD